MSKIPALHPTVRGWLLDGPLAAHVPAYVARLKRRPLRGQHRRLAASAPGALRALDVAVPLVSRAARREPRRAVPARAPAALRLRAAAMRHPREAHAALMPLLAMLRQRGVISRPAVADRADRRGAQPLRRPHARCARPERRHARRAGCASSSGCCWRKFAGRPLRFDELRARGRPPLHRRAAGAAQHDQQRRHDQRRAARLPALAWQLAATRCSRCWASSPRRAHWSLASLPRALKPEQVERVLNSFTAHAAHRPSAATPSSAWRSIWGCASAEINRLQLDDIDWRSGTVTLKRTKSRRQDVLPLLEATGKALEDYIRHERPASRNRAVFVRHLAPHDRARSAWTPSAAWCADAFRRAGIPHGRTHALRHTLACRLVGGGSPIKEVADVLRHRSLNTSLIYAKLNLGALAEVALPWPGSAS